MYESSHIIKICTMTSETTEKAQFASHCAVPIFQNGARREVPAFPCPKTPGVHVMP